ncbi:erythrocyte membrane protein 1 varPAM [Plasmodium falciparum RAJ116]|uniref:Erythrocyte membrane protein 1 varPAM n=1 Tax=Plasmodium falciparum RAJ116 TaxID=580058 RepID=A0A0L0CXI1_PLAFA|nr:erythrocyte membrane protein 1 varPAM [Plasmodium falciparum RAJ116]
MGNASSSEGEAKTPSLTESHNSARNVLENIARIIKEKASNDAKRHRNVLKGYLSQAKFYHPFSKERPYYKSACHLDYAFHSNTPGNRREFRHPCAGRNKTRFSNESEAECSNSRINGNKDGCGACAPYRRRHMCDYNLEYINEKNVLTTHDLLGNILVTAKYEGDYIVNNHSNRGSSEVCIGLARSFADIGDIVRGKDMFKPNDKVENALREVFNNIYGQLENNAKAYYSDKDKSGNYYKLREDWWTANRDQVWKAITCSAPGDINYFRKISDGFSTFSSHGKCGHNEGAPPTNLDYVPQFLRWFEEWAEEFCRIRKDKLKKVKEVCRGEHDDKYCDGNGYDCKQTDISRNILFVDLNCPRCEEECTSYNEWIEKKIEEFSKQKKKYDKEIGRSSTFSNNEYDTRFYESLGKRYPLVNSFLDPMKEGLNCSMDTVDGKIDFEKLDVTFSPSSFCKTCPLYGVKCNNSTRKCTVNSNDKNTREIINDKNATHIDVEMIYHRGKNIKEDQKKLFKKSCLFRTIRNENWRCNVYNTLDVCRLNNFQEKIDPDEKIRFNVLIDRWLKDFIKGYYISKQKIEPCIPKENEQLCIISCKEKCTCVENWIKKKENEWKTITQYSNKKKHADSLNIVHKVRRYFDQIKSYVNKYIDDYDVLKNQGEHEDCIDGDDCTSENKKNKNDFVIILLNRLQNKITTCKTQHDESRNKDSCNTSPKPLPRRRQRGVLRLSRVLRVRVPRARQGGEREAEEVEEDKDGQESGPTQPEAPPESVPKEEVNVCKIVEEVLSKPPHSITGGIDSCNPKDYGGTYPGWDCTNKNVKAEHNGACIPPRRIKLCVSGLTQEGKITKIEDIRTQFIKCAAIETYFAWLRYKKINTEADKELKEGKIPDEFKRQMYYTFGDYRDIFFGTDISTHAHISDVSSKVNHLLQNDNKEKEKPEDWWNKHGKEIWEAMLCALTNGVKENDEKKKILEAYSYEELNKKTNSITPLEDFANKPQFLRWMIEWGEEFCKKRKEQLQILQDACKEYECNISAEDTKTKCEQACKKYQAFIEQWKPQYEKQTAKFDKDKKDKKFDDTPAEVDVHGVSSVHEYLQEQLKNLCTKGDCACMEKPSAQDEETELLGENYFPEAMDYPPKEINKKCDCAIPPESMSCVEKTAHKIRKNAEKNVKNYESSLKGTGNKFNGTCNLIEKQNNNHRGNNCDFNTRYPNAFQSLNVSCDNNGKERFKIEEEWKCEADTTDGKNKLCVPPRRKDMCLNKLEDIIGDNISDSNTLLEKIQYVAQNEGDDIIYKLLSKYPCNESVICDAMKYSFADIGDIIRGRSKIKTNNGDNIEDKLKEIFKQIQTNNKSTSLKTIDLTLFREKWWDANRKEVWKAMTCNAPKDAELKKRINNPGDTSKPVDSQNSETQTEQTKKCGYDKEPPDYDYIPERYRFLQEWSEYYCKALNKKQDEMKKECDQCNTQNGTECENYKDDNVCNQCKTKCEKYKEFVGKWNNEFDEQNEIYKKLYIHDRTYGNSTARRDPSIKFTQKLDKICENPDSAEKYLDKSTHCTDYKFSETNSNGSNYAFSPYPKEYKDKCKCYEKSTRESDKILNFIKDNIFKSPNIPGLNKIKKAIPRIPKRIKNIRPDAHTIHELVARTFPYFVPFFQKDDKTPPTHNILNDVLPSAIPVGIALALTSIAFLYLKKKTHSPVDLLRVLDIPKGDYGMPTLESKNRYIPYRSGTYKGKTYIYMEGDSDSGHYYEDTTDITSSESEYEELDINDIYVPHAPKYKTLIEVVLEPSGKNTPSDTQNDIQSDDTPSNKFSDNEWNTLKDEFISQYLQSEQPNDLPNDYRSGTIPTNTNNTTPSHDNVDNNTNTTMSRDNMEEKPFITSIHDRDLYTGEEISYNINMSTNSMDDPKYVSNNVYSGIDLINDTLSGNQHIDIYDEVLKRKENELFGTNYKKNTSNNSVAKELCGDPIMNQINLLHEWLDRHRDMCEQWNNKEDILNKLKEEWEQDNDVGDIPNDNKMLNTDVSIQIDIDENKGKKEFSNMDTNVDTPTMDNMEDDIYYDVNDDENPSVYDIPMDHNKVDVPKKVHVEMKILNNTSNGSLEPEFPISDVWNI